MAAKVVLVLVLVAVTTTLALAQGSGTANCTTALTGLYPCLSFITTNATDPSVICCSQLDNVVKSEPVCLCRLLNGSFAIPGTVNQTKTLTLPDACNIDAPSPDACKTLATGGSATPPSSTGNGTSKDPSNGTGTKVSSQPQERAHGTLTKMSISLIFFALSIASYIFH